MESVRNDYAVGVVVPVSAVTGTTGKLKHTRYCCTGCGKNLTMETRIRCVECVARAPVDLCLNCMCSGSEFGSHSRHHSYQVFSSLHFPVFNKSWGAEEELLLLEGLTLYGFGNWSDVAEHVGTKSEDECFDHYSRVFGSASRDFPSPLDVDGAPTATGKMLDVQEYLKHRKNTNKKTQTSNPIKPELGGYMPYRNEFEFPYNDQAEVPVAAIKFSESDSPDDKKLKMDVLRVYHHVLDERERRTDFVVRHNLLQWKKLQKFQRNLADEEDRKLVKKLAPVLQVTARDKWDALVDGMLRENSLRRLIKYYGDLRKEGIRTEREMEEYVQRSRKKAKYPSRQAQSALGPPALYDGGFGGTGSTGGDGSGPGGGAVGVGGAGSTLARQSSFGSLSGGGGGRVGGFTLNNMSLFVDPANARSLDVMGASERRLINELNILPNLYLIVKEVMLREYCRAGRLSKKDAKLLSPCDPLLAGEIYNFLVEERWIGERGE